MEQEEDIASLIPGDWVFVTVEAGKRRMMVYAGHGFPLCKDTKCSFIEIPSGYTGQDVEQFYIWKSNIQDLQFPRGFLTLNSLHKDLDVVRAGTEKYASIKSLCELVIK